VLADIDEEALRAATDELTVAGHQTLAVTCDVSDEDQVGALVERTVDTFGRLDMAFNNAGIQVPPSDAADEPAENFDRVNAVNLKSGTSGWYIRRGEQRFDDDFFDSLHHEHMRSCCPAVVPYLSLPPAGGSGVAGRHRSRFTCRWTRRSPVAAVVRIDACRHDCHSASRCRWAASLAGDAARAQLRSSAA
jgi:NAD(P)-dependent dehydrogenase (short-subunit alcohol dehydrogenase family)